MENQKNQVCTQDAEGKEYREKIINMINIVNEKRFLKAIYISVSEYLKGKEPE